MENIKAPLPVEILEDVSLETILLKMKERKPILIRNWDIGPCVSKWNSLYVSDKVGTGPVKIHVSLDGRMDFINKNFLYKTLPFNELIRRIFKADFSLEQFDCFIHEDEFYYLRSLGADPRGKDVANFTKQCRELAEDLKIPPFFEEKDFFSTVFRASSKGLQVWTHYDIMDNILIQVTGIKKLVLWPPSEVDRLYLQGDKSQVLEIYDPDRTKYPKFPRAVRYECLMSPGDIVFIPALWFHNTTAIEPCLGVNTFWKNLTHEFYNKHDAYGNKDLLAAAKALRVVEVADKSLDILPREYKNFYLRRMIRILKNSLKNNDTN